uniref:Serine/arginine repetitive matrix 4 n=1 Tax=Astyanax mexicanus TaxID=7994 RepID=A0A8B9K4Q4_ASTMX
GISRAKAVGKAVSPEKLRFTDRDNASDSGNSLTSYHSAGKTAPSESTLSGSAFKKIKRSYSRLSSYSRDSRRGSVCSVGSRRSLKHSRYTPDRKRGSGSSENQSKRRRKSRRRRASTPLRKRRRDSPSHLEARRITRSGMMLYILSFLKDTKLTKIQYLFFTVRGRDPSRTTGRVRPHPPAAAVFRPAAAVARSPAAAAAAHPGTLSTAAVGVAAGRDANLRLTLNFIRKQ